MNYDEIAHLRIVLPVPTYLASTMLDTSELIDACMDVSSTVLIEKQVMAKVYAYYAHEK